MVFFCDCFKRNEYQQIGSPVVIRDAGPRFGVRHIQCILTFFGLAVAYSLRVNLSVAIVAMTDKNATNPNFEEFDWNPQIKSYLLSSFFWGYVITQVPGGYLSHRYGAKYTLCFGIFICSCLTVLTPLFAKIGDWQLLLVVRVIEGLSQGMIFPSTHTYLSKWAPIKERGRLVTLTYSGSQFGTVAMLSVSGFMAKSRYGWPSIFYISGAIGIVWATIWFLYAASTPAEHANISIAERRYIEADEQGRRASMEGRSSNISAVKPPWCKIFKSTAFLALLAAHCANNWGFWTLLTEIPSYMKSILGVDIKSNGPLSALPYLAMWLLSFVFIFVADILNHANSMSLSTSRKLFNTIGSWVPMLALIGLGYVSGGDSVKLAIALLTLAVGINSATYLGFHVNHLDLSPNFAGSLMGITNCAANVMSIIAPLTVGLLVTDEKNPHEWRTVFTITSVIYFLGNLLFLLFGRTTVQSFNDVTNSAAARRTSNIQSDNEDEETAPLYHDRTS